MTGPTLSDERLDRMRTSVLSGVDDDVARRGRRGRKVLGGVAAASFVIVVGGVGLTALGTGDDGGGLAMPGISSSEESGAAQESAPAEDGSKDSTERSGDQPGDAADRDVVTTGSIDVTVRDPRTAAQQLATWVETQGGRIDQRSETGTGDDASAVLTIRVPSDRVTAAVEELDGYGQVERTDIEKQDVGNQRRDLDARIRSTRVSVERLESFLGEASGSEELLQAEEALSARQAELERLESERTSLRDRVGLSTLTVSLDQRSTAQEEDPSGFVGGVLTGWSALVSAATAVVSVVGVLLPWIAVGVVGWSAWRLARRRTSRT